MEYFIEIVTKFLEGTGIVVGLIGVLVILIGCFKAVYSYFTTLDQKKVTVFGTSRSLITSHILLGLDFLIAKDIIDTILLSETIKTGEVGVFVMEFANLLVIIVVRLVLTHFLEKELEDLQTVSENSHKK